MKALVLSIAILAASVAFAFAKESFQVLTPQTATARARNPDQNFWIVQGKDFQEAYVDHDRSTKPEMHEHYLDYLTIVGGSAKLVIGGDIQGSKQTAPGEWHAETASGTKSYDLKPGTLVVIPPNVWHSFSIPGGSHLAFALVKHHDE